MRTIVWWWRVGVKAIGLVLLTGCDSSKQFAPNFQPVDAVQRASVLDATAKLREVFNGDKACESIFNFPSYPKERWLADCAQLQTWAHGRTSALDFVERCGMPEVAICVDGDATFAKGNRILELIWLLDNGRAQIRTIGWREDNEWIWIPPLANPHRHWDPPPNPGKSRPEKS